MMAVSNGNQPLHVIQYSSNSDNSNSNNSNSNSNNSDYKQHKIREKIRR